MFEIIRDMNQTQLLEMFDSLEPFSLGTTIKYDGAGRELIEQCYNTPASAIGLLNLHDWVAVELVRRNRTMLERNTV